MKLQHLEYVIAIAQEGSITAAAKKLYQAQPNISIALKELESSIGMQIFWRTPNGMVLTPEGEEFLVRAKKIVEDMHSLEADYNDRSSDGVSLKVSSARSTYIPAAIGIWLNQFDDPKNKVVIRLTEAISHNVIDEVTSGKADMGVIRIPTSQAQIYAQQLNSRKLMCHPLIAFNMKLLMRADHPLAAYDDVPFEKLRDYVEIVHSDDELNVFGRTTINADYQEDPNRRLLYVSDRGSKTSLLNTVKNAFMWVAPVPKQAFPGQEVVLKKCSYANIEMQDIIICKKSAENNRTVRSCMEFIANFVKVAFSEIGVRIISEEEFQEQ